MSVYLDTRGNATLAVAICDRCKMKFPYDELEADRDNPGLRVCKADNDIRDPYKLPPIKPEKVTLRYPRPDVELT